MAGGVGGLTVGGGFLLALVGFGDVLGDAFVFFFLLVGGEGLAVFAEGAGDEDAIDVGVFGLAGDGFLGVAFAVGFVEAAGAFVDVGLLDGFGGALVVFDCVHEGGDVGEGTGGGGVGRGRLGERGGGEGEEEGDGWGHWGSGWTGG